MSVFNSSPTDNILPFYPSRNRYFILVITRLIKTFSNVYCISAFNYVNPCSRIFFLWNKF